jgi:hypothetical protein
MIGETGPLPEPAPDLAPAEPSVPQPLIEVKEFGGREGPDPTRYGDWEKNGRCIDF